MPLEIFSERMEEVLVVPAQLRSVLSPNLAALSKEDRKAVSFGFADMEMIRQAVFVAGQADRNPVITGAEGSLPSARAALELLRVSFAISTRLTDPVKCGGSAPDGTLRQIGGCPRGVVVGGGNVCSFAYVSTKRGLCNCFG
jgi:hypothetical protein